MREDIDEMTDYIGIQESLEDDFEGSGDSVVDALNRIGYSSTRLEDDFEGSGDMVVDALNCHSGCATPDKSVKKIIREAGIVAVVYDKPKKSAAGKKYEICIESRDTMLFSKEEFEKFTRKIFRELE